MKEIITEEVLRHVHSFGDAARRRGRGPDHRLHNVGLDVRRDAGRRSQPAAADDERRAVPGRRSPALRLVPVAAPSSPGSGLAGSDPRRVAARPVPSSASRCPPPARAAPPGRSRIPAGTAALLLASVPVWMIITSRIVDNERITILTAGGLVLGLAGVAVLINPLVGAAPGICSHRPSRSGGRCAGAAGRSTPSEPRTPASRCLPAAWR